MDKARTLYKKVYLSGPMSSKPRNGHDDFAEATRWLRSIGHEVVSPHEMDRHAGINEDGTLKPDEYANRLAGDIHTILWVDAVVVLPAWEESPGAKAEVAFARAIGRPILSYPNLNEVSQDGKSAWLKYSETVLGQDPMEGFDDALRTAVSRVVSPTGGEKDSKAQRFDLVPWDAVARIAEVYSHGCTKYSPRNWERGYAWGLSFASLQRHLTAFWNRQGNDPESGLPHLAHAGFHLLALLHFSGDEDYTEHDDRP